MTTELAPAPQPLDLALLKAIGLDRLAPEQRQLAMSIAERYQLDLLLKHLVMIEGRPYVTRDGLLHIAHRSGQLDGMATSEPAVIDGFWRSTCSVYRKDMSHPFTYTGRYPTAGGNQKFAPEMAVKVGEVMALRRAFDVSAPVLEERWDVDVPAVEPVARPTLAERAAAKAAELPFKAVNAYPPEQPLDEPAESTPTVSSGLSLERFSALARKGFKGKAAIAAVLGCEVAQVVERLESMTDTEREVLADELNLDWR